MKTFLKKSIICLAIILLSLSCFCCTSVEASGIQSRAYYENGPFQFSGHSNAIVKNYDGNYMAIEAKATSSSGSSVPVRIEVFLYNRNVTETYTVYSNGSTIKFDYIYLGSSASSDVAIMCFCDSSDTITIELTSYSWYT